MASNLERLRQGEAIEFEPGLSGRLNKEKKTLELSNGRVLNVAHDQDYFPQDQKQHALSQQREHIERKAKGSGGEFYHQFSNQGLLGSGSDIISYLTQSGDEYATRKQAEQQVSQRISEESPYTSGAATVASFVPDIIATRGMSALKAAPLLTAASSGSRLLTEPGEVAGESLLSAGLGYGVDKAAGYLNRVAQRRGEVRALPGRQQAVSEANALQTEEFNALRNNVKSVNEQRLQKHQSDLAARQNTIIQEQNAYEQRKLQRDAEVIRLKNKAEMEKAQRAATAAQSDAEYRAAKSAADQENKRMSEQFKLDQVQYQQALKELPELQKQAQQEYSANVVKNAEGISNAFPKDSKIFSSQFGVGEFIDESIKKSGIAGSREGNQAQRILKSLFPEGEILTGKELANRYKALEGAIQKATPEVREVLNEFKTHMGSRMPTILADNLAYTRIVPSLKKQIEKEVVSVLDTMGLAESGIASRSFLKSRATSNVNRLFRELTPQDFMKKMQSGEIRDQILKSVMNPNDFGSGGLGSLSTRKNVRAKDVISPDEFERLGIKIPNPGKDKFDEFNNLFMTKLDKALAKAELKMIATDVDASTKLGAKVRKTYGTAEPVAPPNAPIAPEHLASPLPPGELPPISPAQLPPPVAPPQVPPMPGKPGLMAEPPAPMLQAEPMLNPASGAAEMTGDFLEKPILGGGGQGITNNPLVKLGGLKYLLGKAAVPAEAAYLGMKGLTSPTAGGEVARMTFKQGGIQAIENWASQYPSYQNGILQSPQDRRSLTKEVEDDFEIPLEQKAVIQSKINRGRPLQERL